MTISKKTRRLTKSVIVTALLMIARPLNDSGRTQSESMVDMFHFSGKTLVCGIDLGDDMRGGHGLETGFAYEVMKDFARDHNCNIKVVAGDKDADYTDSLRMGVIDILIMHNEESNDGLLMSDNIIDCSALAVGQGKEGHIREINSWLSEYTVSEEFNQHKKMFFRAFNPIKKAEKGVKTETVSPYDSLFKEYAKDLGWDWRLLAAVVYQESKFSISSRSHRGASGLMQVMPQTGAFYNVDNLMDPHQNLLAGTSHLKRLQKLYSSSQMSDLERIHFTLAAYNAGEGRIRDCRSLARAKRLDENVWANIVSVIPMMREDSILDDENVRLGKFTGAETIAYVDNVMALYDAICQICPR
jgi:membrane-bound lytic murein transglycosylase MltF